jgi:transcriptional regulator with XRE-family HTH domain
MSDEASQRERLAQALSARGKTIQQLADALGLTYQAIKKVIDGKTTALTAANTFAAAEALKISAEWLATGQGEMLGQLACPLTSPLRSAWLHADEAQQRTAENAARNVLGLDLLPRVETRKLRAASA